MRRRCSLCERKRLVHAVSLVLGKVMRTMLRAAVISLSGRYALMAMRLRLEEGVWVALCAVQHPAKEGDVYLDDGQDHAIREKLWADWDSERRRWPRVRITKGSAGTRFHVVREGSDPLESLCGRAYAEPHPQEVVLHDLLQWQTVCRSCRQSVSVDKASAGD